MHPYFNTDSLKELFVPASRAFVAFLFWIIFQYVFKLDFQCPCDPGENTQVCVIYMILPAISLFIVMMIADKRIRRICCNNGTEIQCKCIIFSMSAFKALSVACLWIIAVLIDGDWYACLKTTNYSLPPYEQSFCKEKKNPAEDADIRTKKSLSREIAICVLFGLSVSWIFKAVCSQSSCMQSLQSCCEQSLQSSCMQSLQSCCEQSCCKKSLQSLQSCCKKSLQSLQSCCKKSLQSCCESLQCLQSCCEQSCCKESLQFLQSCCKEYLQILQSCMQSLPKRPLTYQYNKILLEETDLYITKKLKKLAKDEAKRRGQEQIDNAKLTTTTLQVASNQANPEQQDRSSETSTL